MRALLNSVGLSLLIFSAIGCDVFGVDGNGERASEQRDTGEFDSIDSRGSFAVEVEQGDEFAVTVRIDSNLMDSIETRVVAGELRISTTEPIGKTLPGPHVLITVPQLTAATLSGSGRVGIDLEQAAELSLRLSGSGEIAWRGEVPALSAHLSGSGEFSLAGKTDDALLDLSGSGTIDARELSAAHATIELSGSGDIIANVDGGVAIELGGSGDIDLFGDHHVERLSKRGSGALHEH